MTEAAGESPAQRGNAAIVVPTPDENARLRALIRDELDRQHALPLARRTLELLAEASVEPVAGEPGYRIVDRAGETRLRPVAPEQAKKGAVPDTALSLDELVGELRARHPALFGTPPVPEPEPTGPAEPEVTLQDRVAHVRAAGARFVETQSTLARTFAAQSAERGRTLASAASGTVETWRNRIDERAKAQAAPTAAPDAERTREATVAAGATPNRRDWRALANGAIRARIGAFRRIGGNASLPGDAVHPASQPPSATTGRTRSLAIAGAGFAALGLLLAVLLKPSERSESGTPPVSGQGQGTEATSPPSPPQATADKVPPPASPVDTAARPGQPPASAATPSAPPADLEEQPDEAPARVPNEVAGVPEVIDTATLRIGGKVVRLYGVEWVRGGQADELTKYLAKRPVSCQPAPGSSAYMCSVNGRDLSEVVLFNGGGRASPEAGPELVAAEDHARGERLGVWKR